MNEIQRWFTFRPWERHSLVLLVGGLVYIGVGIVFMSTSELTPARKATLIFALQHAEFSTWGFIFAVGGCLACASSRWPNVKNAWGYMILTGLSAGWASMYLLGYIFVFTHHATLGYALVWSLLAFLWWAISGLVNPEQVVKVVEAEGLKNANGHT